MNWPTILIAMFVTAGIARGGDNVKRSECAAEVVAQWVAATQAVTSVRGKVSVIYYDDTLGRTSNASGTFGYFSPRDGFWLVDNTSVGPAEDPECGKRYKREAFTPQHYQWHDGRFYEVDIELKRYFEHRLPETMPTVPPSSETGFWASLVRKLLLIDFTTPDFVSPFFPGLPNKAAVDKWTFQVTNESATHIWLRGLPKSESDKIWYASCDLYLQKEPLVLIGVQCTEPGGRARRVLLFSDVEINPADQCKPDISNYKCIKMHHEMPKAE